MDTSTLRILIVEDHALAQKMAMMAIQSLGCETDIAKNGADAITLFRQHSYDLIFMDLGLPDMDGYTVTETIRQLEGKNQTYTPIIALTAHAEEEFQKNAFESGMDDFLSKPLTKNKAMAVINKYVIRKKIA